MFVGTEGKDANLGGEVSEEHDCCNQDQPATDGVRSKKERLQQERSRSSLMIYWLDLNLNRRPGVYLNRFEVETLVSIRLVSSR